MSIVDNSIKDWDSYGACCACKKDMLIEQVVDGRVQKRFTGEYTEVIFLLNDGSKMRVAFCQSCKDKLKVTDEPKIMTVVIKGWQRDVDGYAHWTNEKRKKHMDVYSKKEIVVNAEGKSDDFLKEKLEKFQEKKIIKK